MSAFRIAASTIAALVLCATACQAAQYDVDFKLNSSATYESLQFTVAYSGAGGTFDGSADTVSCTPNASLGSLSTFNDVDSALTLSAAFISTSGVAGPVVLCTCVFTAASAPTAGQFTFTIDAYSPGSSPSVSVSRVQLH